MSVGDADGTWQIPNLDNPSSRPYGFIFSISPSSLRFSTWMDNGATPFPFAMGHHAYSRPSMWLQRSLGEHVRERQLNPCWPRVDRHDFQINRIGDSSDDEETWEEGEEGWWENTWNADAGTTADTWSTGGPPSPDRHGPLPEMSVSSSASSSASTSTSHNWTESTWTSSWQQEPEEQQEHQRNSQVPDEEPQQDQEEHQEGQEEQQEQEDQQEQQDEEQETKKEEEQEDQEATGDPSTSTSTSGSSQLVDRSWQLESASAAWLSKVSEDELSLS